MALFLDLDNTFVDSVSIYKTTIRFMCRNAKSYGFSSSIEFSELYEIARREVKEDLYDSPSNRLRLIYFKKMFVSKFGKVEPERILKLESDYFSLFQNGIKDLKMKYASEYAETFALLKSISKKQKLIFCTNENLRTQLLKSKILFPKSIEYLILSSEEVGKEKPSELFFTRAKELVSPESISAMIGDSLKDDVGGALLNGIPAIHVRSIFSARPRTEKKRIQVSNDVEDVTYTETNDIRNALKLFL
ncbi:HAD family hydrolase [Leptospira gomenensis]|uniref:HAD family hydrolase n=1 Tax=Leptospira gomenensis TaxID=2484974 RepID=A0A5F1Y6H4_9LEPT|nr:HAD family hydrolase [Leptospira gomenensis]TGK28067.1 HAD family hydrolase [Leptospira gomenensis]TGK37077.1 HAD family hydrolase [Leptospira gomenensis]TGK45713.1 HAD family hydrolase [Leptospira gomenensis]TGK59652.1 HAD family hydrolase [Leptospira gomenensis]